MISDTHLVAWLRDRAEQYENSYGCKAAIEDLMDRVRKGEHTDAVSSGELDDDVDWAKAYIGGANR